MMAPQYERARMLCTAINYAAAELLEPINRLKVERDHVLIFAGDKRLTLRYSYANNYDHMGVAMPGGGHWVVEKIPAAEKGAGSLQRLVSWLRK